jgi:hypothetical protein
MLVKFMYNTCGSQAGLRFQAILRQLEPAKNKNILQSLCTHSGISFSPDPIFVMSARFTDPEGRTGWRLKMNPVFSPGGNA